MLRATHRVMEAQLPISNGNPRLMAAWRQGERYWRDCFGPTRSNSYTRISATARFEEPYQQPRRWSATCAAGSLSFLRNIGTKE